MQLKSPIIHLLEQLRQMLEALSDQQYTEPVALLSNATIGQHTRHIIEFFIELDKGYESGVVDYDQRSRDSNIENDRQLAMAILRDTMGSLVKPDKTLSLVADFNGSGGGQIAITTNYYRELVYNLEHTVHHMALLRIGIGAVSEIRPPEEFGVAVSTLKFRQACAQ